MHAGRARQRVFGSGEIERIRRKSRKDQTFHDSDRKSLEGTVGASKRFRHLAGNQQMAVQIVSPRVIRAGQAGGLRFSGSTGTETRTAVSTDVEQGANFAARGANDDDRFGPEFDDQVIAGACDAADVARTEPVPKQHAFHVAFEDQRICIEIPCQCVARTVIADQFG